MKRCDVIVVGAGHNGLVSAAYLAKAGAQVLVVERNPMAGGSLGNYEVLPGFIGFTGPHDIRCFSRQVARDLELHRFSLDFLPLREATTLLPDNNFIASHQDPRKSFADIARHSKRDAERLAEYDTELRRQSYVLRTLLHGVPAFDQREESNERLGIPQELVSFAQAHDSYSAYAAARVLFQSCKDYLDYFFENAFVKTHLATPHFFGVADGPFSPGSAFYLLGPTFDKVPSGLGGYVKGGPKALIASLVKALETEGGSIQFDSEVTEVMLEGDKAVGVGLADGTSIEAKYVISNLDPKRSFLTLFDWTSLPRDFVKKIGNYRLSGTLAKMDVALDGLPRFSSLPSERQHLPGKYYLAADLIELERAFDSWKDGIIPQRPLIEFIIPSIIDSSLAPANKHVMSIYVQYVPAVPFDKGWDKQAQERLAQSVIEQLVEHSPNISDLILGWHVSTASDFESKYALTNGDMNHGELVLDQLAFNRPLPKLSNGRGPIENFVLCGAGTRAGPSETGMAGALAAQHVLHDMAARQNV